MTIRWLTIFWSVDVGARILVGTNKTRLTFTPNCICYYVIRNVLIIICLLYFTIVTAVINK